jgi:hypothetical protein
MSDSASEYATPDNQDLDTLLGITESHRASYKAAVADIPDGVCDKMDTLHFFAPEHELEGI